MPLDQFELSGLVKCQCGGVPVDGAMYPPELHFAHCPDCGAWAEADTQQAAVAAWNVQMRWPRGVRR